MAAARFFADAQWTWEPNVGYYAPAAGDEYTGSIDSKGNVWALRYLKAYQLVQGSILRAASEVDDHDASHLLVLDAAGPNPGHILAAYSRVSANAGDIRSWNAEVTVVSASNTFSSLYQTTDSAYTCWYISSDVSTAAARWVYRKSTDGGNTWGAEAPIYAPAVNSTPIAKIARDPASPDDLHWFLISDIPQGGSSKLYYLRMRVQSDGSLGWFTAAGTDVTTGFNPATGWTDLTSWDQVSTTNGDIVSAAAYSGVPYAIHATYSASGTDNFNGCTYNRRYWNGSGWALDPICGGDSAAIGDTPSYGGPDYLYGGQYSYQPGAVLDPNDPTIAYVAVAYGANYAGSGTPQTSGRLTDVRVQKWSRAGGSWAKVADISGATSSENYRPVVIANGPTGRVLYLQGTYTNFGSFSADAWASPPYSTFSAKSAAPTWVPSVGPLGVLGYYLIHEGSGTTLHDLAGGGTYGNGSFVGTPTWGSDAYGPNLSGFSASNYVSLPGALATAWAGAVTTNYPVWAAVLCTNSSTAAATVPFLFANSGSNSFSCGLILNYNNVANQVAAFVSSNVVAKTSVSQVGDGQPHLWMLVLTASNSVSVYCDGSLLVSSGVAGPGVTAGNFNLLTLGAFLRATGGASSPFTGSIGWFACGDGVSPDPLPLARDVLSGQFAGTRAAIVSAVGYTLSGPGSVVVGKQAALTLTPAAAVESDTVSLSADGGTVAPTSLDWTASSAPRSAVYTAPGTPGTYHVTATSADGGAVAGSPLAIVVSAASSRPGNRWYPGLTRRRPR